MNKLFQTINQYLRDYCNDQSVMDVSELHGFFTAIGSSPTPIAVDQWMPEIWGGEEFIPEWTEEEQIKEFVDSITRFYGQVMESLYLNDFHPLFNEISSTDKIDTVADEWCYGYLRGINLWSSLEADDVNFLEDALQAMRMFATDEGLEQLAQQSDEEIQFWLVEIERSVQRIYQHFSTKAMLTQKSVTKTNKIKRNEPCPCGSGNKYKKCCMK